MTELKKALDWLKEYEMLDVNVIGDIPLVFLGRMGFERLAKELGKTPFTEESNLGDNRNYENRLFEADGIIFKNVRLKND